jgi:hypothetical protein
MNHKRRRPKNQRAGCLMCKSHKVNGYSKAAKKLRGGQRRRMESADARQSR